MDFNMFNSMEVLSRKTCLLQAFRLVFHTFWLDTTWLHGLPCPSENGKKLQAGQVFQLGSSMTLILPCFITCICITFGWEMRCCRNVAWNKKDSAHIFLLNIPGRWCLFHLRLLHEHSFVMINLADSMVHVHTASTSRILGTKWCSLQFRLFSKLNGISYRIY